MKAFALTCAIMLALGAGIWWETYRWDDCRAVGHSWLYCAASISR